MSGRLIAAPPTSVMNPRRSVWSSASQRRIAGYRIGNGQSGGIGANLAVDIDAKLGSACVHGCARHYHFGRRLRRHCSEGWASIDGPISGATWTISSAAHKAYEGHAKDYEFSGTSMREHWQSGYEDTRRTLKRRDWIAMPPNGHGIIVHDVHREEDG
jgi:hypothetical protein